MRRISKDGILRVWAKTPQRERWMTYCGPKYAPKRHEAGFTLIELLVALSVIGVAVSVYVSLFSSSVEIGESARNRELAIGLAEGQLRDICARPNAFYWVLPEPLDLKRIELKLAADDPPAGNPFPLPSSLPLDRRSYNRQESIYDKFRWSAFAQMPALDSAFVFVSVVVRWQEGAHVRELALTSALPRVSVEGLSS